MAMVAFGSERRRGVIIAVAGALVLVAVAMVEAFYQTGHRIDATALVPAAAGLALLFRRSGGTIEYETGRDELVVTRRTSVKSAVTRLAKRELTGLAIASAGAYQELRFELEDGKHFVLLRGANAVALERDRAAVAAFLAEHGVLKP